MHDGTTPWTWEATAEGYRASDGRARLVRRPKGGRSKKVVWVLPCGVEHPLPPKATFDHAEAILSR